jgi:ADP-ribosyl-[dinitrogen reductase] hydrolase
VDVTAVPGSAGAKGRAQAASRRRGCLIGLAVGDAFGAPVEFETRAAILTRFPPDGIRELAPWGGRPAGTFTDDTQMSVATARGALDWRAATAWRRGAVADLHALEAALWRRYLEWYASGDWEGRAPGDTCMASLASGRPGSARDEVRNGSKGCGGVMRVAPLGLMGLGAQAFAAGAGAAALTHGHLTSDLSSGFLALLIDGLLDALDLDEAAVRARAHLVAQAGCTETLAAVDAAVRGAASTEDPYAVISRIGAADSEGPGGRGKGWVAEEALGIALFSALRCRDDYREAVHTAATITGDSDSTASIAGAIVGAFHGLDAVPAAWAERVEDGDVLLALADELGEAAV